ncbi:MAG: amino acid permease [Candidatus Eremiobacteraeota bacterium]|nr:amino acid permease [Candidatus Eremiobacteraeota bacterium]
MAVLKRDLSHLDLFCIASGAMISSGLFVLPGIVFKIAGPAIVLAYIIAGVLYIPALLSKAELATAMPRAGGDYFFIDRSLGPAAGTIGGINSWFALSLKSAFALIGIGSIAVLLENSINIVHIKIIAIAFCLIFFVVNLIGVKIASKFQVFLVFGLIGILIYFIARGVFNVNPHNFQPFAQGGIKSILKATGMIFISYAGLTKICSISEEVKDPCKDLPRAMFSAYAVVMVLYALVIFVTIGVTPAADLSGSLTPISLAAKNFLGPIGIIAIIVAAMLAFMTTANAGIMAASRYPIAMSRDGHIPGLLQTTNKKFGTPHISLIFTVGFMIAMILFLDIELLVKTASAIQLIIFALVTTAVIVMRESKILNYRPGFKSPFYPYVHIAGILAYGYLLFLMGMKPIMLSVGFMVLGLGWYLLYTRIQVTRRSALTQMVQNLTDADSDRPLGGAALASELKEIVRERDQIVEDRFDYIVKNCQILDVQGKLELDEFFELVSDKLAKNLDVSSKTLFREFIERESESTTVLRRGIAIPHVIIRGEGKFDMLIARCKDGIKFHSELPAVNMVFVLIGSKDERAFYIRALASIAEITTDESFEKQWMNARNDNQLRDIVLMAERKRIHLIYCRYTPDMDMEMPSDGGKCDL